jgi:hypothetical protein
VLRRRRLLIGGAAVVVATAIVGGMLVATARPDPLMVVHGWTASRNAGDVDTAMSYLAEDAKVFNQLIATPVGEAKVREILAAQAVAGWTIHDSDCSVDDETVACRYRMDDQVLRRWGISFSGRHEFTIRNGKLAEVRRYHDAASRQAAYAALADFKAWVRQEHADLLYVIWSDAQSVTYATPKGAAAMLHLLDEYEAAR